MKEKTRMIMTKIVNIISAKMEMGAPMISMYLLGNPDHYTDHKFVPFFWQSFVTEAERAFRDDLAPMKVALVKQKGRIVGVSPVFDYVYRPLELEHMSLYEWVHRCSRVKLPKIKKLKEKRDDDNNDLETSLPSGNVSFDSISGCLSDSPVSQATHSRSIYNFLSDHPLHESHGLQLHKADPKKIPNFIGATLPRKDQGDRDYYCLTMLALFKPWRKGSDLKANGYISWHEVFEQHSFSEEHITLIQNFHIKYECLDARDDYRAQLAKEGPAMLVSSWDNDNGDYDVIDPTAIPAGDFDPGDIPSFLQEGALYRKRKEQCLTIRRLLASVGWTRENKENKPHITESIKPMKLRSSAEWKTETTKYRQLLLDKRKETNDSTSSAKHTEVCNIVKVVDKSYLQKAYHAGESHAFIEQSIKKYTLNREQERAF